MGTYGSRYDPLPFVVWGDAVPRPFGVSPCFRWPDVRIKHKKPCKKHKIEYSSRIFNSFYLYTLYFTTYISLTNLKTMEYSQIKIINHINDKRAEMLKTLKTLKKINHKETCCVRNYKNFIDVALADNKNGNTMSEKDCEKFFRLGEVINTVFAEKRKIAQKLDSLQCSKLA